MSTNSPVTPETLITVKVVFNDQNRRFKLALKDLSAQVFPDKLRTLLGVSPYANVTFERYSDSANSYVVLDTNNTSVYKQMYRAAKAKLKLRLRATVAPINLFPTASVEEQAESVRSVPLPSYEAVSAIPVTPSPPAPAPAPVNPSGLIDASVAKAMNEFCTSEQFRSTVREEVEKQVSESTASLPDLIPFRKQFPDRSMTVYCNSCNKVINAQHFHCDKCDSGDYDLCQSCVQKGLHCLDFSHWMGKREIIEGKVVSSHVEFVKRNSTRVCNNCVNGNEAAEDQFVHCLECPDFDLCLQCFRSQVHGHDPRHRFSPSNSNFKLTAQENLMCSPGRAVMHPAHCDGCDRKIVGIRHKCIDCPDWDYCNDCVSYASHDHPNHRFVPLFDNTLPFAVSRIPHANTIHGGISCDGPICVNRSQGCIIGARYKCAICPDTDFCAACEASPLNTHNASHPLIKLKTAVRNVLVSTTEEQHIGARTMMGDVRTMPPPPPPATNSTEVQTVADFKPEDSIPELVSAPEPEPREVLKAEFVDDAVSDGTVLPVGENFTQTWFMKNAGTTDWPAGVSIRFVGGDYMFLKSEEDKLQSTTTNGTVAPGAIANFSVNLSATWPANKQYSSYWRLVGPDGVPFGDKLWCTINVKEEEVDTPAVKQEPVEVDAAPEVHEESHETETVNSDLHSIESVIDVDSVKSEPEMDQEDKDMERMTHSQQSAELRFPKLEVESPVNSIEQLPTPTPERQIADEHPAVTIALSENGSEDITSIADTDESFLTDEEYDVVDGSDEEEFEECERLN